MGLGDGGTRLARRTRSAKTAGGEGDGEEDPGTDAFPEPAPKKRAVAVADSPAEPGEWISPPPSTPPYTPLN